MKRCVWMLSVVAVLAAGPVRVCQAEGWWSRFWRSVATDFRRNNCWPEPFIYPNRAAVRVPFQVMVARGWQRHNTLGQEYFDPETQQLTQAGKLKVQWIMTQAPMERRVVYVNPASTAQATQARLASVRQAVSAYVERGQVNEHLALTRTPEAKWPGADITAIGQRFRGAQPAPVLPQQSTTEEQ